MTTAADRAELSIIIVSYNARADLVCCLQSLAAAPPLATHEIIVVDNASTDGSADAARAEHAQVIDAGANLGFARANNVGIRSSTGRHLLILNSDTIVPQGALDALLRRLAQRDDVAAVGPRLIDATGRAELSFGKMIHPVVEWRQKRLVTGNARGNRRIAAKVDALTRREQEVDWVSGACLLVRRADAEAVGLFDERYFMYTEDVDFCAALRAHGRRVLFVPSVEVVHLRGRSAASAPASTARAYAQSRLAFYEKHLPRWAPVLRLLFRARGTDI
jgi:hypothetical protein